MKDAKALFPRYVLCRDGICSENLDVFKSHLIDNYKGKSTYRDDFLNVDTTHRDIDLNLKNDPVFTPLIQEIKAQAFEFACFLGYGFDQAFMFEITNMWVNFSGENDFNWPHIHPGSILSGAYYVENENDTNYITFFDHYSAVDFPINSMSGIDTSKQDFACTKGRMLLFKSDLPHGNTPQKGQGQKITISFNIR